MTQRCKFTWLLITMSLVAVASGKPYYYYTPECRCTPVSIGCDNYAFTSKCALALPRVQESNSSCVGDHCNSWWNDTLRCWKSRKSAMQLAVDIRQERDFALQTQASLHTSRKRRAAPQCYPANSLTANGVLRICSECNVATDLGIGLSPRFVNEVLCTPNAKCFSGEGACIQQTFVIRLQTTDGAMNYEMKTGCSCRLYRGSVLTLLN